MNRYMAKKASKKTVETLKHQDASRKNIPTAEYQAVMKTDDESPIETAYRRRNRDLDPQLVWRGKDKQDRSNLVVQAPPLFIQEKVQPKVLIDDLWRRSKQTEAEKADESGFQPDLFADFNGLPSDDARTEFYRHDANWSNRMILGDSLQVMASLAEREGLRGTVQCIYLDPPYGIKFNSNFQWSTTSRDVKDGKADHITREPEQVKAFRDTWRDGIHSYLTYLRDRLTVARDLLTESGSIFVQIGDENVHRVRALMDEVFGDQNFVASISYRVFGVRASRYLDDTTDNLIWYAKREEDAKYRQLFDNDVSEASDYQPVRLYRPDFSQSLNFDFKYEQRTYRPPSNMHWATGEAGLRRLKAADRLIGFRADVRYKRYTKDFPCKVMTTSWQDTWGDPVKSYVVQTSAMVVKRCILMATDPGDLVLDPTCGSGTTAYVAEQWGRRWITIDTSRVALALARARIMGARYPYYLLSDSRDGQLKDAEVEGKAPSDAPAYSNIRQGFVYERIPHVMLKSIANNAEIDVIWEKHEERLAPLREQLSAVVSEEWIVECRKTSHSSLSTNDSLHSLAEWEIPREFPETWPEDAKVLHEEFWTAMVARQREIDASIAAKADYEYLYDKPYEDNRKVRVAGAFTVDSLSPHRVLDVDENDELIDHVAEARLGYGEKQDFAGMILEHLKTSGVQQAHKEDRIAFSAIKPWPGDLVCAEGAYIEGDADSGTEKRAAIFIGPEFGTVSRPDLVQAAREAADADFDVLIACAFNYEAHSTDFDKLGRVPVLKARMNADLHMAGDLKNTGKGNLFVIFGEPDIDILDADDGQIQVKVKGVDVFHPNTGEIRSDSADGIACWFVDTDYNEESFFVRHAYFLGANDPYKALRTTLKAEINQEAWETLHSDTSRPFEKPKSGRIAVKVINHLGDEVMKVFRV